MAMEKRGAAQILLAHGGGGLLSRKLIEDVFLRAFSNRYLDPLNDQAILSVKAE